MNIPGGVGSNGFARNRVSRQWNPGLDSMGGAWPRQSVCSVPGGWGIMQTMKHPILVRALFLIPVLLFNRSTADAQPLTPVESAVVQAVDTGVPRYLKLLETTVNINSGTLNQDGVSRVGQVLAKEFEALGFSTRWVDGSEWGRAGHLIAEREGDADAPRVLLIGHLDTVFEPDSPFQTYELLDADSARGPGTTDMKGGNLIMLLALEALIRADALPGYGITAILTGDEEKPGRPLALARRDLMELADRADIVLGFEDGDGDPATAVIARRGSTGWKLVTTGAAAHSSQIFREDVGYGAVYEAARVLDGFRRELAGEANLTFNPGVILGGTEVTFDRGASAGTAFGKSNVIAEEVVVAGDLRTLTPEQLDRARKAMERIVADHLPGTGGSITFGDGYPPMAPTEGNRRLLAMFDQASRDLGFGPVAAVDPARAGAADISFTAGRVDMALDGLGLMGSGGHTERETADLRTLPIQAKRVALVLLRLETGPQR